MKKLRMNQVAIPSRPAGEADNVGGTAFDIKCFPPSRQGRPGPFAGAPVRPPPLPYSAGTDVAIQQHFDDWVAYFVNLVGAKLENLNGLQFNLDQDRTGNAQLISDELGKLADELKVGSAKGPKELLWPLAGSYKFAWSQADAAAIDFQSFVIHLYFENEPDYRMVVNCAIEISAKATVAAPNSSSSSYIATSSSG